MKTIWTSHLRGEDKKKFEDLIRNSMSKAVVDRLLTIIQDNIESVDMTNSDYEVASWAYWQAHRNGYKQAMQEIQSLFDLGEKR
jgi:hypothetical protein